MSKQRGNDNGGAMGCALILFFAIVAMPILGLYLAVAGEESEVKLLGIALLIVGIIVWLKVGIGG